MEFIDPAIDEYAKNHTSPESEILKDLNRETYLKILQPRMLSGHLQGRVLSMLSKMIKPKNILEIGTYTGYSAICLAEGLASDGTIDTIDINEELQPIIKRYLDRAGLSNQVQLHLGNALEIIPNLYQSYDLVFIDADKDNYISYLDLVLPKIPVGAYIIADNVLWSGKVLERDEIENDKDTAALVEFNQKVMANEQLENVLLPVRDGLMIIRKIAE